MAGPQGRVHDHRPRTRRHHSVRGNIASSGFCDATRRAEPEGKGAQLSTAQRIVIEFVRDVNEEIAMCANRDDLSPETVRRLGTELNRAEEAIARRLGRP